MNIDSQFTVNAPIATAWSVLTDLEVVATCLPGAQLTGHEGEVYEGRIKVKVGPVTQEFAGTAQFSSKDDANYRATIAARGKDARGAGNASADITTYMTETAGKTVVHVTTDLTISGKLAQFGKSTIAEISNKLMKQFADSLEAQIAARSGGAAPAPATTGTTGTATPAAAAPAASEPEALNLMSIAGKALAKRLIPVVLVLAVVGVVLGLTIH